MILHYFSIYITFFIKIIVGENTPHHKHTSTAPQLKKPMIFYRIIDDDFG